MTYSALLALCLILPFGAWAQSVMLPEAFDAFSRGRTLHFTYQGQPFGSEQFFSDRRTLWQFDNGPCAAGLWHAEGDSICFSYDGGATTQCWMFVETDTGPRAELISGETPFALDFSHADTRPLACPGPRVGS